MSHPHPELSAPPALAAGGVRIVALGGLGEIGRNMTVIEYQGKLLIVDCGVLFPEDDHPGVDLILPDFSFIEDRMDDVVAIVLTHGHEDHIGAVPYLLRAKPDIPLVGSQLTLALVEAKFKEHRIKPYTLGVAEGDTEDLSPFECEFIAVNHSIPDALAVCIRTAGGTLLHTGDFKMDQVPPKPFTSSKRNQALVEVGAYTQMDWYAQYPHMYVGDAHPATAEKGRFMVEHEIEALVELIRVVKADQITPGLVAEFNRRMDAPMSPGFWTQK